MQKIKILNHINKIDVIVLAISAVFFTGAIFIDSPFFVKLTLFVAAYILSGGDILVKAARNLLKGKVFDENFLMSVATLGAFAIGQFPEGVAVMLFYKTGELLQEAAVGKSKSTIQSLLEIKPEYANIKSGDKVKRVSPDKVVPGDTILVKPGEKVPLDGIIIEGNSTVDASAITGESLPSDVGCEDEILSGTVNINGLLTVRVIREFKESAVSKILEMVQNAESKKSETEKFITKFAGFYTPVVVFAALFIALLPPVVLEGALFTDWIYRALVFLVISCPCALVISIPLSFFGGIGGGAKHGILFKGGNYLEAMNNIDTVVFDKTGTLTEGVFKVSDISPAENSTMGLEKLLEIAACAESGSNHPIAQCILKEYGKTLNSERIKKYEEKPGYGIKIELDGKEVLAGNLKFMESRNIRTNFQQDSGTVVHIAFGGKYAGYIQFEDEIKKDAKKAVERLKKAGVKKVAMLTGDNKEIGDKVGKALGMDIVHSGLLPEGKIEKLELIENEKKTKGKIVFVGDGINDAPVLSRADVGVAMGGIGSDIAIESADVVIINDEPSKIADAIEIAKRTRRIVWQNISLAFIVKGIFLVLGAGGLATMWEAVFADVGVALIAVINSMRVLNFKK